MTAEQAKYGSAVPAPKGRRGSQHYAVGPGLCAGRAASSSVRSERQRALPYAVQLDGRHVPPLARCPGASPAGAVARQRSGGAGWEVAWRPGLAV